MGKSLIPKINLGVKKDRVKIDISQDTSTTANFGFCQPTFAREMVPGDTFKMHSVESFVRLAPVSVPTFGRISYRNYHTFVPYSSLYFGFDSLLSGTSYSNANGNSFTPLSLPSFGMKELLSAIFNWQSSSNQLIYDIRVYTPMSESVASTWYGRNLFMWGGTASAMFKGRTTYGVDWNEYQAISADMEQTGIESGTYEGNLKIVFRGRMANLFKIFVGLGYNFNAFSSHYMSVLPLLAYYKSWFNLFYPQRDMNFFGTNAYHFITMISNQNGKFITSWSDKEKETFLLFLVDCSECYYIMPPDYFSASTTTINVVNQGIDFYSPSGITSGVVDVEDEAHVSNYGGATDSSEITMSQRIALKLLRFANKNTIFGKSLRNYLISTYGVSDEHDNIHEEVVKIGADSVNVVISDIMSTADTVSADGNTGAQIGEYSGKGIGYGKSHDCEYTAKQFGIWITLSCVVPEGGYVQGLRRENKHLTRFDFFTPEFDALGMQTLDVDELFNNPDYSGQHNNMIMNKAFGLIPRYSEYKVGRNTLNGDLYRLATKDSLNNYTLDRLFEFSHNARDFTGLVNDPKIFRSIGLIEMYGNYNRIFDVQDPSSDHFIIHMIFNVDRISNMKSLKNSYDTYDDDDKTIEMSKQ